MQSPQRFFVTLCKPVVLVFQPLCLYLLERKEKEWLLCTYVQIKYSCLIASLLATVANDLPQTEPSACKRGKTMYVCRAWSFSRFVRLSQRQKKKDRIWKVVRQSYSLSSHFETGLSLLTEDRDVFASVQEASIQMRIRKSHTASRVHAWTRPWPCLFVGWHSFIRG